VLTVLAGALSFFSWRDDTALTYQALALVALALLLVPLLALGGSAARLSARRRDERLATLRLLGATPAFVARLTVLESAALALAGGVLGVVGYLALLPGVALIPFGGHPIGLAALWLGVPVVLAALAAVVLLAAVSAALGLRGVVISPLGVRTRQKADGVHWIRAAVTAAVVVAAFLAMSALQLAGGVIVILAVLVGAFGGTLAVLGLVGPLVLRGVARRGVRRATTAEQLLAARSVLESPKAAWRQVGGVAMTSFVAVFAGSALAVVDALSSGQTADAASLLIAGDIRTGVIITLVVSFLMVACSVSINQASAVLDRRELYVGLDRIGMPLRSMDRARSRAVLSPLLVVTIGSSLVAAVVMLPLTGAALLLAPLSLLTIGCSLAGGVALVWAGLRLTRPVLRRVLELKSDGHF